MPGNCREIPKVKIPADMPVYLRYQHQHGGLKCSKLVQMYPQYSARSIYRHGNKPVGNIFTINNTKSKAGRRRILTLRDERQIIWQLYLLRGQRVPFTAKRIRTEAAVNNVSERTVRGCLNKYGYRYRQSRKKGLLSKDDMKKPKKFANRVLNTLPKHFWTEGVSFYFHGVGFAHKTNPADEARSTPTLTWRKPQESLSRITKGKREESGGRVAHFFVAIAYGKDFLSYEQYFGTLTGESFVEHVRQYFPAIFENSPNPFGELFLQGGDPRQVSMLHIVLWMMSGA